MTADLDSLPFPDFTVVLAHPYSPENIGAAARAIRNTGIGRLIVSEGPPLDDPDALKMACNSEYVLANAKSVNSLSEALEGAAFVIGTTGRTIPDRRALNAREGALAALSHRHLGPVVILFGNEKSGLSDRELHHCDRIVRIPTAVPNGSLNLAQAVMIMTYELYGTHLAGLPPAWQGAEAVVGTENQSKWNEGLIKVLERAGFFKAHEQPRTVAILRDILARLNLRNHEIGMLRTLIAKLNWSGMTPKVDEPQLPELLELPD
ncbi:MAG: RNA methyltransferase [Candidatus Sericytochromatia bacterium]|nr:RNA methyltransferase [Candidatus Sericytochromatia bacterium]